MGADGSWIKSMNFRGYYYHYHACFGVGLCDNFETAKMAIQKTQLYSHLATFKTMASRIVSMSKVKTTARLPPSRSAKKRSDKGNGRILI